ncbi:hypothetical protein GALL_438280 [mine drainage metagenome]|uniref:Uncharacterized protein n=1 Tax=mine drainage metagenome TaxID=410659 RepID=A0A1J5PSQ9_9ZZZZ
MGHGLHSLGNHLAVKRCGQIQHPQQNRQIIRVVKHVVHKTLVHLELVDRQALEVGQRRVTGTEIVQRKVHPQLAALRHDLGHALNIL